MKTEYIKPEVQTEEIVVEKMIATSIPVPVGEEVENGTTDTRGRRGTWGNLWE